MGISVPDAASMIFRETRGPIHAKDLCQRLIEGGMQIRGKTPVTSIATSLKRDPRFRKVGPNTFEHVESTDKTVNASA